MLHQHILPPQQWSPHLKPVFWIRIRTDLHKEMPPGSGSAWTDTDPDLGGKTA